VLRRIWAQLRKAALRVRLGERWSAERGAAGFARRAYPDYDAYLAHQALKREALRATSLDGHARRFEAALQERLAAGPLELRGAAVLCLGAREGAEVRAFIRCGAFAVGVDLNPGPDNRWVVRGDFHDLQFADGSVDVVYTNALDHALELDRLLAEVRRVLEPGGALLVEVGRGTEEGGAPGFYESLAWPRVDELVARIEAAGFERVRSVAFDVPWSGVQQLLRKRA
jgi:SAM-dependent methyltransferase